MKIYFTVKSMGKRKPFLAKKEYRLSTVPHTLKELITDIVQHHVQTFNAEAGEGRLLSFLTGEEVGALGAEGKVSFGSRYDDRMANEEDAVQGALLAFRDGLFKVFLREEEIPELESELQLQDGDDVAFIKFTMLAGRLW